MPYIEEPVSHSPDTTSAATTPAPGATVDNTATTVSDPYAARRHGAARIVQAIYLVFGVIEALIAMRIVLHALGANPNAGFAQLVYGLTAPLVAPFAGLFGNPQANGNVLELQSVVALVVYALVAWVLGKLVWLMLGESRSAVTTSSKSVETRT
jgi:uncharacterized protein YggT (Ycf19 family)